MKDPFPAAPAFIINACEPVAAALGLKTLPFHIHEVVAAFCFYQWINVVVAPSLSTWLYPRIYPYLAKRTRINWNVHVVSLVQSSVISALAIWVIYADQDRKKMDWNDRVWGYTGAIGLVQALAAGYFVWDVMVSSMHLDVLGPGSLAHAISALTVSALGFVSLATSMLVERRGQGTDGRLHSGHF